MYILQIGKKEIEIKTNLGIVKKIEETFKHRPFIQVVKELENMTIDEVIRFLLCGVNADEKEETKELIMENIGIEELYNAVTEFIEEIQYPGKTKKEKEAKKQEQLKKAKEMREAGLIQ